MPENETGVEGNSSQVKLDKNPASNLPDSADIQHEEKPECMSCKAIAVLCPLAISAYTIYGWASLERIKTYKIAKNPRWMTANGTPKWRMQHHRFNMVVLVPFLLCYGVYSRIFNFGMHHPDEVLARKRYKEKKAAGETPDTFSMSDINVDAAKDVAKRDMDSFTRGTLELADWFSKESTERKKGLKDMFQRISQMFSWSSTSEVKPVDKSDK